MIERLSSNSELKTNKPISLISPINETSTNKIRTHLALVLDSSIFARSKRIKSFLKYIVNETLEGRGSFIKEYSIAIDVFGKNDFVENNDDSVVRTTAKRLRTMLTNYYQLNGENREIYIVIPKGSYVPEFHSNFYINNTELLSISSDKIVTSIVESRTESSISSSRNPVKAILRWNMRARTLSVAAAVGLFLLTLGFVTMHLWSVIPQKMQIFVRYTSQEDKMSLRDIEFKHTLISTLVSLNPANIIDLGKVVDGDNKYLKSDFILDVVLYNGEEATNVITRLLEATSKRIVWTKITVINEASDDFTEQAVKLAENVYSEVRSLGDNSPSRNQ